jgi:putative endonuclease
MSWYLYILECSDDKGSLYTGITNNLQARIDTHNKGKGAKYTKTRRPVKLLYFENHPDRSSATKQENKVKKFSRAKKFDYMKNSVLIPTCFVD